MLCSVSFRFVLFELLVFSTNIIRCVCLFIFHPQNVCHFFAWFQLRKINRMINDAHMYYIVHADCRKMVQSKTKWHWFSALHRAHARTCKVNKVFSKSLNSETGTQQYFDHIDIIVLLNCCRNGQRLTTYSTQCFSKFYNGKIDIDFCIL